MENELVLLEIKERIAYVRLNRPEKLNGLNMAMFYGIKNVIQKIRKNSKIRAVILSGNGSDFCSGLDVKSVMSNQNNILKLLWKWWPTNANLAQQVSVGWRHLKVPVICAIHGKCWGGGMQIALGADFRIASPDASLAIMETRWGLIPDMGGTLALRENMSCEQAMKLAMTGEPITTQQALSINLISQIANEPIAAAKELVDFLLTRSPDTNKIIKTLYHKAWSKSDGKLLAAETYSQWRILLGKNQKIAVKRQLGDKHKEFI